jgi:hypothetical protein
MSVGALAITGTFLCVSHPVQVQANTGDLAWAVAQYPQISNSRINSCSLCHTSSIPSLNPYGAAYLANGRSPAAFAPIEALDSDGDGFTNLQEINALTFPGNPADKPTPTATARPTNTPTKAPLPTNTPTSAPQPTNTPTRPSATSIPTNTAVPTQAGTLPPTATRPAPSATATTPPIPMPSATPGSPNPTQRPTARPSAMPPIADRLRLTAVADAYVSAKDPGKNFGGDPSLKVADNAQILSYLRFNVPDTVAGHKIQRAILRLYIDKASGNGFTIRRVSGTAWSEKEITFSSAPKPGDALGASPSHLSTGRWVTIDITSLVGGPGSYSLALIARHNSSATFSSRETGNHAPTLTLSFGNPPGGGDDHNGGGDD